MAIGYSTKVAIDHLIISFNNEKWSLKTQMWVPCGFLLVKGTQNVIPGSWVSRNSLRDYFMGCFIECIYRVS